jgi:hypothetical protein
LSITGPTDYNNVPSNQESKVAMEAIDVAEQRERGHKHGFGDAHATANNDPTHDIVFCGRRECASDRKTRRNSYVKVVGIVLTQLFRTGVAFWSPSAGAAPLTVSVDIPRLSRLRDGR